MRIVRRGETPEQSLIRKSINSASQRSIKSKTMTLDDVITSFKAKQKWDQIMCVHTVCHRMMCYHSVYQLRKNKYSKADSEMLLSLFCHVCL